MGPLEWDTGCAPAIRESSSVASGRTLRINAKAATSAIGSGSEAARSEAADPATPCAVAAILLSLAYAGASWTSPVPVLAAVSMIPGRVTAIPVTASQKTGGGREAPTASASSSSATRAAGVRYQPFPASSVFPAASEAVLSVSEIFLEPAASFSGTASAKVKVATRVGLTFALRSSASVPVSEVRYASAIRSLSAAAG